MKLLASCAGLIAFAEAERVAVGVVTHRRGETKTVLKAERARACCMGLLLLVPRSRLSPSRMGYTATNNMTLGMAGK